MNPFMDNPPLMVFVSMTIGLYAGKYIGIIDGRQREQKAQAERNRIQQELRWERHKKRDEQWQKFSGQVK
jgi:hypothetical protein